MSESEKTPESGNRLIHETSPYLLQHAHNPVDWYPWGAEALERAKQEDKLILLSIGYSACHWCHVMERESFEDEAIAALMNEKFINIKVDREERPDLDEIYMSATVAMNRGQGGWPMTVFLTPGLEPVFAGTYFPPDDMYGRPGFRSVLSEVARAWREDREALRERAQEFADQLRTRLSTGPPLAVGERELRGALEGYSGQFDSEYGGFGAAPKFPPAVGLSLLLRLHRRFSDPRALLMVRKTLDAMARGGMYDHIGGGFARYSTDRRWLVPHFEKMLYDNALLAKAYLEGYQATGDPLFRRVAVETLDYVLREMTDSRGGFYSSTDADSEGEEGKFFVWRPEEVESVLGDREEARRFCSYYDISLAGNWEGKSILNAPRTMSAVAEELGAAVDDLERTLTLARAKMYAAREERVKPGLDDKILTAWNGLMIGAMAEGHRVLRDTRYLEAAERAANFALQTLSRDDGGLLRTYRAGKAHLNAYLEDYTYLAEGLLDLYESGGSLRWLREAERLLQRTLHDFGDEATGAFYNTARDHEPLIMRYQDGADGATPAANAVAASILARLSYHLDRPAWRSAAARAIRAYGSLISRYPRGFAKSLCVVDFLLEGPVELAFVGRRDQQGLEALQREVARHHLPNRIQAILHTDARTGAEDLPLLRGKTLVKGEAALYVCRDFACQAPLTDADDIAAQLASAGADSVAKTIAVRLPGRATPEGTASHAARVAPHCYVSLGATGLTSSRLGFGGYRTHDRAPEHRDALLLALRSGLNLIDTSTNYADGASERLVGSVLHELIDADELNREQVIVVSKIGYLQGTNLELAREREREGDGYPEMVKFEDGLWHCIHPSFLQDQLERSLDRLELETIDFCLLHNPEYFLGDAARRGQPLESARQEFYRRVGLAFHYLESQLREGRLGGYGVSSNTVVAPAAQDDAISLTRLLDAARKTCGETHHFQVLQLPLNLFESAAVFERNCGPDSSQTVLEAAAAAEIAVLVNRPLNAIVRGALFRLADAAVDASAVAVEANVERLAEMEVRFSLEIAPLLRISSSPDVGQLFDLAERLRRIHPAINGLAQWDQVEAQIRHSVSALAAMLDHKLEGEVAETWAAWRNAYLPELEETLRELRRQAAETQQARALEIAGTIDPTLPPERRDASLSRKALWVLTSTPGVACVLNGMRRPQYVEDSVEVLRWPRLENAAEVYRAAERLSR